MAGAWRDPYPWCEVRFAPAARIYAGEEESGDMRHCSYSAGVRRDAKPSGMSSCGLGNELSVVTAGNQALRLSKAKLGGVLVLLPVITFFLPCFFMTLRI